MEVTGAGVIAAGAAVSLDWARELLLSYSANAVPV